MKITGTFRKILIGVLACLVLAIAGVGYALHKVPDWTREAASDYGRSIGYEIQLGEINFSLTRLTFEVNHVFLAPLQNHPASSDKVIDSHSLPPFAIPSDALISFKRLAIELDSDGLFHSKLHIHDISIDYPVVQLLRLPAEHSYKGQPNDIWNWQKLVQSSLDYAKSNVKPESKGEQKPFNLQIDHVQINSGVLKIDDQQSNFHELYDGVSIDLKDLVKQENPTPEIEGQFNIQLGEVGIPMPPKKGIDGKVIQKSIQLGKVSLSGDVDGDPSTEMIWRFQAHLANGSISGKGQWNGRTGALKADGDIKNIALEPLIVLLPANRTLKTHSGDVSGIWKVSLSGSEWQTHADLDFNNVLIYEPDQKEELLGWENAKIRGLDVSGGGATTNLIVQDIALTNPSGRFIMYEDRTSNFRRLFSDPDQPSGVAIKVTDTHQDKPPVPQADTNKSPALNLEIKTISLRGGHVYFSDRSIKPLFQSEIIDLHGTLIGVSNLAGRYASMALDGRVDKSGEVVFRGSLAFSDPRRNNDVTINFRRIPLVSINPYSKTFAGYEILGGTISLKLSYKVSDANLKGNNLIIINQIQLGNEVPGYQGPSLPLRLAVALLEDGDGVIDLNIPVSGNVDDPTFSTGHLVWQAIKTVLTNIVTAPFRALGHLLGISNFDGVYFEPGEGTLRLPEKEKLEKIAGVLQKKPKIQITIFGVYDPQADASRLAHSVVNRRIFKAAGFQIPDNDPLPKLSLEDDRIQAGLKTVYIQDFGYLKWTQFQVMGPSGSGKWQKLHDDLIASVSIDARRLEGLGVARASMAKQVIVQFDPSLQDRVALGDPKKVTIGEQGIALDLEFTN